ncbi:transcript variant X1 [Nothobranchius furzeri]|uniref:Transcript variant X1 n=1 Tax=Nothobranchius furzeri TaxID=105023 RepID=A0A9D3C1W1_NOTFU|nr:transcript variant X1 [Nothobranchius furzeri]
MKFIRVLVLLLLTSVHIFTPVLSSEAGQETNSNVTESQTTSEQRAVLVTNTTTKSLDQTESSTSTAPTSAQGVTSGPQTPSTTTNLFTKDVPIGRTTTVKTLLTTAVSTQKPSVTTMLTANQTTKENLTSNIDKPLGHVDMTTMNNDSEPNVSMTDSKDKIQILTQPEKKDEKPQPPQKHAGADKRLWWIVLPALLFVGAIAIVFKFKSKKVHDHSALLSFCLCSASFQSRPESTKDGVMLLGVKSSGTEENAAMS